MLTVYFFDPRCEIEKLFFIRYICAAKVNKAKNRPIMAVHESGQSEAFQ